MERFFRRAEPQALSVRDLLEARDLYQTHIANLPTVLGTAIGRYRIRRDDPNFSDEHAEQEGVDLGPRTLTNSDFKSWSWPCVLVFVNRWLSRDELALQPALGVPPVLYLPDGRQVRTCPILVEKRLRDLPSAEAAVYGTTQVGPNFQLFVEDQGVTRMGVATAIVEDGACAYMLVSRHLVAGAELNSEVFAYPRGARTKLGVVTPRIVEGVTLQEVYPGFAGRSTELTLDAALVKIGNVDQCTSHYLGIGQMGAPVDLSSDRMSLNLIGCPLYTLLPGGIRVEAKVHGLFYRHATIGGRDSVTEFLIGSREPNGSVETRPGDSGVVWFWDEVADEANKPKGKGPDWALVTGDAPGKSSLPVAVQWGGQGLSSTSETMEFVLAAGLSSVCKTLNVDAVQSWSENQHQYWGKVGHYNIGYAACFALRYEKAKVLFEANATSIGVSDEDIVKGKLPTATQRTKFIALADVPDLVWRATRGKDKANHFADMDEKGQGDFAGKTLLELWRHKKSSRSPKVWNEFYDSIDAARKPAHRGALPFRVAQIYKEMVEAVRGKNLERYICAAGVLAHYVGDACQPLHVSYLHHGEPDDEGDDKVHAVYEDAMLTRAAADVVAGVKQRVIDAAAPTYFHGGEGAANAVVELMRRTVKELPPAEVLEVYGRTKGRTQTAEMWAELGERTMNRMADGAVTLATVWESAWLEGREKPLATSRWTNVRDRCHSRH